MLEDLDVLDSHSISAERTQPSAESLRENILLKAKSSLITKGTSIYPANLASNPGVTGSPSPAWDQFPYLMIHSFIYSLIRHRGTRAHPVPDIRLGTRHSTEKRPDFLLSARSPINQRKVGVELT